MTNFLPVCVSSSPGHQSPHHAVAHLFSCEYAGLLVSNVLMDGLPDVCVRRAVFTLINGRQLQAGCQPLALQTALTNKSINHGRDFVSASHQAELQPKHFAVSRSYTVSVQLTQHFDLPS